MDETDEINKKRRDTGIDLLIIDGRKRLIGKNNSGHRFEILELDILEISVNNLARKLFRLRQRYIAFSGVHFPEENQGLPFLRT